MSYRAYLLTALLLISPPLYSYSNCSFKLKNYETVCKKALSKGVDIEYVNNFLLSFHSAKRDYVSLEKFRPSMLTKHKKSEKRANNALISFLPQIEKHLRRHRALYDRVEQDYGVNREVIAAILAKETRLGTYRLKHDSYTVFNTLLHELKPKSSRDKRLIKMAENNLVDLMDFCYQNSIAPQSCRLKSSYAGAVGIAQFMPQNLHLAKTYRDLPPDLDNIEDAITSVASFLNSVASFKTLIDWDKIADMRVVEDEWYEFDYKHSNASFIYYKDGKYSCFACGDNSLKYLSSYVKKIMKYNASSHYAIGVLRLAYEMRELR